MHLCVVWQGMLTHYWACSVAYKMSSFVQGCSGDERQLADNMVAVISPGREPCKITEGEEGEHFWSSLGGKTEYATGKWLEEVVPTYPPRLFQCSNASGCFKVEEIFDFAQEVSASCILHFENTLSNIVLFYSGGMK